jgi:carbon-monoxide dehydrogenase medium subunit
MERKVGDFATVAVAVSLAMEDGHISRAGIGLTAVGPKNVRAADAEASLAGAEPTAEVFAEAGRLAAAAADPQSDLRGSADYKRNVVSVFVQRGLAQAVAAAASAN